MSEAKKAPEVTIWDQSIDMPGTQHERRTYYMTLRDGDRDITFILRWQANGTIVAEPYVLHELGYDDSYDDEEEEDEDEYIDEEDDEEAT